MKKTVRFIIIGAMVGLGAGYFLFAKAGGSYINPLTIFVPAQGLLDKFTGTVMGLGAIRANILISGAVGAGAGLVASLFLGKR